MSRVKYDEYTINDKTDRRNKRMTRREKASHVVEGQEFIRHGEPKPLTFKTQKQKEFHDSIYKNDQTLVFGPAGVGKTYIAVACAAYMYLTGKIQKIVITRPVVGTGRTIGLLPGDLNEKMGVWLAETIVLLKEQLGTGTYDIALKHGDIEIVALEHIRGRSFSNTFIFMTEAQNTTIEEMKALVTRIGEDSKLVLDGDVLQSDLKEGNGMLWAIESIQDTYELQEYSGVVQFGIGDVVRSGLCAAWVRAIWSKR